jgi:hypothetical protein
MAYGLGLLSIGWTIHTSPQMRDWTHLIALLAVFEWLVVK